MKTPEERWAQANGGQMDSWGCPLIYKAAFLRELTEAQEEMKAACIEEAKRTCHQLASLCRESTDKAACAYRDAANQIETNIKHCTGPTPEVSTHTPVEKDVANLEAWAAQHFKALYSRVKDLEDWRKS